MVEATERYVNAGLKNTHPLEVTTKVIFIAELRTAASLLMISLIPWQ